MAHSVHPLAGKMGVGPPIAPANWRWRAGKLRKNMYFYTPPPEEKIIRSKRELEQVLAKMKNAPSMDEFCWRVSAELATRSDFVCEDARPKSDWGMACPWPRSAHVEEDAPSSRPQLWTNSKTVSSKLERKGQLSAINTTSKSSRAVDSPENEKDLEGPIQKQKRKSDDPELHKQYGSKIPGDHDFLKVEPLAERAPMRKGLPNSLARPGNLTRIRYSHSIPHNSARSRAISAATARSKVKAKKYKKSKPLSTPRSFKLILEYQCSFEWLSDPETLSNFLEDADRAKDLSPPEIDEFRVLLRARKDTKSELLQYQEVVLRVFISLLGGHPHPQMNKNDLADLFLSYVA